MDPAFTAETRQFDSTLVGEIFELFDRTVFVSNTELREVMAADWVAEVLEGESRCLEKAVWRTGSFDPERRLLSAFDVFQKLSS